MNRHVQVMRQRGCDHFLFLCVDRLPWILNMSQDTAFWNAPPEMMSSCHRWFCAQPSSFFRYRRHALSNVRHPCHSALRSVVELISASAFLYPTDRDDGIAAKAYDAAATKMFSLFDLIFIWWAYGCHIIFLYERIKEDKYHGGLVEGLGDVVQRRRGRSRPRVHFFFFPFSHLR